MYKEKVDILEIVNSKVRISFDKRKMCSCCNFFNLCSKGKDTLLIDNYELYLKKGDSVEIGIDGKKTIVANLLVFFIPITILILSLIYFNDKGELVSFFLGILSLCIYYCAIKIFFRAYIKKFKLKILRKL